MKATFISSQRLKFWFWCLPHLVTVTSMYKPMKFKSSQMTQKVPLPLKAQTVPLDYMTQKCSH